MIDRSRHYMRDPQRGKAVGRGTSSFGRYLVSTVEILTRRRVDSLLCKQAYGAYLRCSQMRLPNKEIPLTQRMLEYGNSGSLVDN